MKKSLLFNYSYIFREQIRKTYHKYKSNPDVESQKIAERYEKLFGREALDQLEDFDMAYEVFEKDYSNDGYCHEQSFVWGFQEGAKWLMNQI